MNDEKNRHGSVADESSAFDGLAVNREATERGQATEELRKYREHLEELVQDRTVELARANGELERTNERLEREIVERARTEEELKSHAAALESANRALRESNRIAEAATRAKSAFLANTSHEIRTPMTAILGFTDVLLGNLEREEDVAAATTIRRNGEYLLGIIDDILDLSKIESGKLDLELSCCSPYQVVAEVVSLMNVRAEAKGLPLIAEYAGLIPETITTDPTRIRQILINLIANAIKFTEVGSVRIVTRLVESAGKERWLQFDVIDTGIGMTEEQASRLFLPFTQVDTSAKRKFGGSGLGLVISKRLAGMLGGDIRVTSAEGKGCTFSATVATGPLDGVPWVDYSIRETAAAKQPGPSAEKREVKLDCRILLAEDGPDNQRLIAFLLRKAGAEVVVAENGRVAVEMAMACSPGWGRRYDDEREPFDIILMDMQMPVMDGYEATEQLRREGYTGPIVAVTAHAMKHDEQECREVGCDDYMTKPIKRDKLLEMVNRHVEAYWRREETKAVVKT